VVPTAATNQWFLPRCQWKTYRPGEPDHGNHIYANGQIPLADQSPFAAKVLSLLPPAKHRGRRWRQQLRLPRPLIKP